MVKLVARLQSAWRRHGTIGTIFLAGRNIAYCLRNRRSESAPVDPFDATYGSDTAAIREIGSLAASDAAAVRAAVRYQASDAQLVQGVLSRLPIDYREYSFIDFGSGKGRTLMVAAGFPFKSVVGIELFRELHEVAARNLAQLPAAAVRAEAIETVNGDAARFEPPRHNLACYLYNPFGPPVIAAVARRLAAHHQKHGCRVVVIYVDPRHRAVFEETGQFDILEDTPPVLILTSPPSGPAATAAS